MAVSPKTSSSNRKGSGKRRRYRGRTVQPDGSPRSHTHGGHSPARKGWETGQTEAYPTKIIPGRFRVRLPNNVFRHGGEATPATKGPR